MSYNYANTDNDQNSSLGQLLLLVILLGPITIAVLYACYWAYGKINKRRKSHD